MPSAIRRHPACFQASRIQRHESKPPSLHPRAAGHDCARSSVRFRSRSVRCARRTASRVRCRPAHPCRTRPARCAVCQANHARMAGLGRSPRCQGLHASDASAPGRRRPAVCRADGSSPLDGWPWASGQRHAAYRPASAPCRPRCRRSFAVALPRARPAFRCLCQCLGHPRRSLLCAGGTARGRSGRPAAGPPSARTAGPGGRSGRRAPARLRRGPPRRQG